jgi:hypothetical protein
MRERERERSSDVILTSVPSTNALVARWFACWCASSLGLTPYEQSLLGFPSVCLSHVVPQAECDAPIVYGVKDSSDIKKDAVFDLCVVVSPCEPYPVHGDPFFRPKACNLEF